MLVVGGETSGIPGSIKKQINHHVSIPGKGNIDSLNAAIAGGILLQKLTKINWKQFYNITMYKNNLLNFNIFKNI